MSLPRKRAAHLGDPRVPLESQEQATLVGWLDAKRLIYCAVPNGGYRNRVEAARLVGQGVKRGVPDILLFDVPPCPMVGRLGEVSAGLVASSFYLRPFYRGIAIEMKRRDSTASSITEEQLQWGLSLSARGWFWFVARGAGEAIAVLEKLGF